MSNSVGLTAVKSLLQYLNMRLLLLTFVLFSLAISAKPFTINIIETYQGHTQQTTLENLYTALYAPLNITPVVVYYPSKRGLKLVNQGILDAEAGRFELTAKRYPNLVKVNEPLDVFHSGFYCLSKEKCQFTPDSNIAVLTSFQSAQTFCQSMKIKCHFESKAISVARMLEKNIAQGFLSSTIEANKVLCALHADKVYFHNELSLARLSYHYVNKRHAALVPKLEHSLRQLKQANILPQTKIDSPAMNFTCGKTIINV